MNKPYLLLGFLLVGLLAYLAGQYSAAPAAAAQSTVTSTFQRIVDSGVLRCGYVLYPTYLTKDPNSGKLSGLSYDLTEELARRLGLTVEWTEEVSWGTYIEGLKTKRYDALCSLGWAYGAEAKYVLFSKPAFADGLGVFVRADDRRFDSGIAALNSADMTIVSSDGSLVGVLAKEYFPKANVRFIPAFGDEFSQLAMEVDSHKADATLGSASAGQVYALAQPNVLRNLIPEKPLNFFSNSYIMLMGEHQLQAMLNAALDEMHNSGFIKRLIAQYQAQGLEVYPVQAAFQTDGH